MMFDFTTLLNSLGRSPGDLVYHLVVGLAFLILFLTTPQRSGKSSQLKTESRRLIGAGLLLSFQVLLIVIGPMLNLQERIPALIASLVETLIHLLTLVWVVWILIEPDETFVITGAALFTSLALLLWGAVSTVMLLLQPAFLPAENNWMLAVYDLSGIALAALGCLVLLLKRPQVWGVGAAILLFLGLGYGLQFLHAEPETVRPGAIRLAETLALPWVLVLHHRLRPSEPGREPDVDQPQRVDLKPILVDELLQISLLEKREARQRALARVLSLSLVADMCYLVDLDDQGTGLCLLAGYDLIRERNLPSVHLSTVELPNILLAWENAQPYLPGHPPHETQDGATLSEIINYQRIGRVLAFPLGTREQPLRGGVIFLSPYTGKTFGQAGLRLMAQIEATLVKVLFEPTLEEKQASQLAEAERNATQSQEKCALLSSALSETQKTVKQQEAEIRQLKGKYQIEKLEIIKEIDACQEKIIQLSAQAASHKRNMAKLDELQARIRELIAEREHLAQALAQAENRRLDLETHLASAPLPPDRPTQNEILSLDAIAANIKLAFEPRCQHKDVNLEITNPDKGQLIKSDPNQLLCLLHNLMENALLASPPEGALQFQMKLSYETGMLHIQVTDSGQGLSPGEQRAMFSETEKNPPGIGKRQALREALQLVQSLNGKIWLRSQPDAGTTFRVQLPVRILD